MIFYHLISLSFAYVLDTFIGDPPNWPHPVRWIGSLIFYLEKRMNRGKGKRLKGLIMTSIIVFLAGSLTFLVIHVCYELHPIAGIFIESIILLPTIARKSLKNAALAVYDPIIDHNLVLARRNLSYIVGRDTDQLDEKEIIRGVVETVAENTSDGITAPLFWSLIGGGVFAMIYRAVNTCDSMVGYKNDRFFEYGFASAKLDDFMNWMPSRLTSFLMVWTKKPCGHTRRQVWKIVLRDAKKHPSPNSGWCEAAVAGLLGIQLGGQNIYEGVLSNRALMGNDLVKKKPEHIVLAIQIMNRTTFLFILMLWMGGILFEMARSWWSIP